MKLRQKRDPSKCSPFFGLELTKLLLDKRVTQRALAASLGKSDSWIGDMMHGERTTPASAVDAICDTLSANEQERYRLHVAAARDAGFRIPVFL